MLQSTLKSIIVSSSGSRSAGFAFFLASVLSCFPAIGFAQQTAVWQSIDDHDISYTGTWQYHNVIAVANEQDYVLIGRKGNDLNEVRRLRHTLDGGKTWNDVLTDGSSGQTPGEMWVETWTDVAHPVPQLMLVSGYRSSFEPNVLNQTGQKHTGFYLLSIDGGLNFERVDLDSNSRPAAISMCSATHGVMTIQQIGNKNNPDPYGRPLQILRSDDGWQSTSLHSFPDGVIHSEHIVCPEPDTYIAMCYNATLGDYRVYRTIDGGQNWQVSAALPNGIGGSKISFVNSSLGWAAGKQSGSGEEQTNGVLAKTVDGGLTWEIVYTDDSAPNHGLRAVEFANESDGIAVGAGPKILRTRDGGSTWRQEYIPYALNTIAPLNFLVYPAKDFAIAVFSARHIIKYSGKQNLLPPVFLQPIGTSFQEVDEVTIEWTAIEGADQYQIQIALTPFEHKVQYDRSIYESAIVNQTVDQTNISLTELSFNHCYYARVRAINDQQISDWREYRRGCLFITLESDPPLLAPAIQQPFNGASVEPVDVVISWEALPGDVRYDLQVATEDPQFQFPNEFLVNETGLQNSSFTISKLPPQEMFFLRVRARTARNASHWTPMSGPPYSFFTDAISAINNDDLTDNSSANIIISPQPAQNEITLVLRGFVSGRNVTLKLTDTAGREVFTHSQPHFEGLELNYDVHNLRSGLYFLTVSQAGVVSSRAVHIQR